MMDMFSLIYVIIFIVNLAVGIPSKLQSAIEDIKTTSKYERTLNNPEKSHFNAEQFISNVTDHTTDVTTIEYTDQLLIDSINNTETSTASMNAEFTRKQHNLYADEANDYDEIQLTPSVRQLFAKQLGLPNLPDIGGLLVSNTPCSCQNSLCGCCTGMLLSAFSTKGCVNITYIPEEFAFEIKMLMNNAVLYKNRLSGRNPPPICVRPPRFRIIQVCAIFSDLYFVGRNMHVCLNMGGYFQGFEIFNRSFNCMRIGDKGVKLMKPNQGGIITKPGTYSAGDDDVDGDGNIEDYDENVLRIFDY